MNLYSILLIALSLSMDAFAISISLGLTCHHKQDYTAIKAGLSFGIFQSGMAILGWTLGSSLKHIINPIDHWIAFLLLTAIGVNFIKESNKNSSEYISIDSLKILVTLSIATSIDALATGVTFSLFDVNIFVAVALIGQITYFASILGVFIGKGLSHQTKLQSYVNIIGGLILIIIGFKILITHFFH